MEQGEGTSSRKQRTYEQSFYWDRLTPIFKVDLHGDFRSSLELPLYFSENVKGKLPHTVDLKGPNPHETAVWKVQITVSNHTVCLVGDGWNGFVGAFSLRENDTLVFKYKNKSYFKVKIIDGRTYCEKESSHFITNLSEAEKVDSEKAKRRCEEGKRSNGQSHVVGGSHERGVPTEAIEDSDSLEEVPFTNMPNGIRSQDYDPVVKVESDAPCATYDTNHTSTKKRTASVMMSLRDARPLIPGADYMCSPCNLQRSRKPTENEILKAKQRANEIKLSTANSFFVAMGPSFVGGRYRLIIPKDWWQTVIMTKCNVYMKLRLKGEDEYGPVRYTCSYDKSRGSSTIVTGWKQFVLKNSLCKHDCCVFKPTKPLKNQEIYMEVEIIRAIETERQLNPVVQSSDGSGSD